MPRVFAIQLESHGGGNCDLASVQRGNRTDRSPDLFADGVVDHQIGLFGSRFVLLIFAGALGDSFDAGMESPVGWYARKGYNGCHDAVVENLPLFQTHGE